MQHTLDHFRPLYHHKAGIRVRPLCHQKAGIRDDLPYFHYVVDVRPGSQRQCFKSLCMPCVDMNVPFSSVSALFTCSVGRKFPAAF